MQLDLSLRCVYSTQYKCAKLECIFCLVFVFIERTVAFKLPCIVLYLNSKIPRLHQDTCNCFKESPNQGGMVTSQWKRVGMLSTNLPLMKRSIYHPAIECSYLVNIIAVGV